MLQNTHHHSYHLLTKHSLRRESNLQGGNMQLCMYVCVWTGVGGQDLRKDGGFTNWLLIDFSSSALLEVASSSPCHSSSLSHYQESSKYTVPWHCKFNSKKTGTSVTCIDILGCLPQCLARGRHLNDHCVSAVSISHNLERMAGNENNKFLLGELQVTQLRPRQETKSEEGLSHTQRYQWILTMANFLGVFM